MNSMRGCVTRRRSRGTTISEVSREALETFLGTGSRRRLAAAAAGRSGRSDILGASKRSRQLSSRTPGPNPQKPNSSAAHRRCRTTVCLRRRRRRAPSRIAGASRNAPWPIDRPDVGHAEVHVSSQHRLGAEAGCGFSAISPPAISPSNLLRRRTGCASRGWWPDTGTCHSAPPMRRWWPLPSASGCARLLSTGVTSPSMRPRRANTVVRTPAVAGSGSPHRATMCGIVEAFLQGAMATTFSAREFNQM